MGSFVAASRALRLPLGALLGVGAVLLAVAPSSAVPVAPTAVTLSGDTYAFADADVTANPSPPGDNGWSMLTWVHAPSTPVLQLAPGVTVRVVPPRQDFWEVGPLTLPSNSSSAPIWPGGVFADHGWTAKVVLQVWSGSSMVDYQEVALDLTPAADYATTGAVDVTIPADTWFTATAYRGAVTTAQPMLAIASDRTVAGARYFEFVSLVDWTGPLIGTATPTTVQAGSQVTIEAGGFQPGETVRFELHSSPVVLGTAVASGSGQVAGTFTVPSTVPAGAHLLVATSVATGFGSTLAVTVTAAPASPAGPQLADTGVEPWPLAAGALSLLLLGLVLRSRSRRRSIARER